MDWDLENENLKLEGMIHIYQQENERLTEENKELEKEVLVLKRRLRYYQLEEETKEDK
tara:strand:+ start:134 stop:307 length:174 start_codon:yes stop_codon:yes gene_type:complete